jgi:cutinase
LFGDPFNGAPVKGIPNEKIKVFCDKSDGVCQGKLQITLGHMSYNTSPRNSGLTDVQAAAKWAKEVVKAS